MHPCRITTIRALALAGLLATTACTDAPAEPTSTGSSDSGDASTSSGTSMPSPSSSGVDSTGSSSSGVTGTGSTGSATDASTGSATEATTSSTTDGSSTGSSTDASTGSSTDASTGSSTGTTGGDAGFCAQVCIDVIDCAPAGGDPADWACPDGFCEYVGMLPPCDPVTCPAVAGLTCALVDGESLCVIPCAMGGNECDLFMLECTGVTDMGGMICQSPPCNGAAEGAPCNIPAFGQVGTCTGGVCMCTDDSECTAAGYACTL